MEVLLASKPGSETDFHHGRGSRLGHDCTGFEILHGGYHDSSDPGSYVMGVEDTAENCSGLHESAPGVQ